jgi:hypothetical protein
MAPTYELIASNTLSSAAASVTFNSIPATYKDLLLKGSVRQNDTGSFNPTTIQYNFNNNSSSIWSYTFLRSLGGVGVSSSRSNNITTINNGIANSSWTGATSNTFANIELYIPSYTASENKPVSLFDVVENNATIDYMVRMQANLFRSTSAVTSIQITAFAGQNLVANTSFFLYGIKNS